MKVYILTKDPYPNGMAATNRIKCYARAIKEGGLDCEVIICGATELRKEVLNREAKGFYEGVPFRYIGGTTTDKRIKPVRLVSQYLKLLETERYLKTNLKKGDAVFFYMGGRVPLTMRLTKIAHQKGAFAVRDLGELPYGTKAETKEAVRMREFTLQKQFPMMDGIVSISDNLMKLAKDNSGPSCHHIKVPIMVEYEHYLIEEKPKNQDIPFIFHAGTLFQQKDGILGMIEAFGLAKQKLNKPVKYILTSNLAKSSHPKEIEALIDKYHLEDSVEFVGFLYRHQIKEYLKNASLVISNRPKSQQDYYGFSTKVGEYLASGTPLILTNWGEAVNWLENGVTAYITEPENTEALADAIVHVFSNPEESRKVGLAGQEVCKTNFDFHNWSNPLADFFQNLGE